MLRQLNNLSSSIKYAANNTAAVFISLSASSKDDLSLPSLQLIAYWIAETQRGLDAFFNDEFDLAHSIFAQHHKESPFHAVGFALMAYVEAMLGFETEKIQIALERIAAAESLAKQFSKKARRKTWYNKHDSPPSTSTSTSTSTNDDSLSQEIVMSISFEDSTSSKKKPRSPDSQYELIVLNCVLMTSTIQFLRNNWLDYMKAAYKLRKAYKLYEQMFESVTGQKTSEYSSNLKKSFKKTPFDHQAQHQAVPIIANSTQAKASWNEKRYSLLQLSTKKPNFEAGSYKKRPMSTIDCYNIESMSPSDVSMETIESAIECGIFFGVGLFSLIFSLLPPRVNKILNTLGFQSSRPFALHLLKRSFKKQSLYSSLSALSLLAYYTNLSLFIHPQLLPDSLHLDNARQILDEMKVSYPHGKIWKLLEGKLCKMEGKTRRGVEILRDARCRESSRSSKKNKNRMLCELVQLQALAVYEMGWGQIFLGDYFQASETFFRLESMNNWSRAFYHYIATCCMFADEEYDKAALEFMQIPFILKRKKQLGGRLLPNEIFAERKIRHWKSKQAKKGNLANVDDVILDGSALKQAVVVHPLWELIYLWNGFSQLTIHTLQYIKQTLETTLASSTEQEIGSDMPLLYLLLGVSVRELGDLDLADMYLRQSFKYHEDELLEDQWVIPHSLYEMAALCCFKLMHTTDIHKKKKLLNQSQEWIHKVEKYLTHKVNNSSLQQEPLTSDSTGDSDWDSRLHVRCQILLEKLEDFNVQ